MEGYRFHLFSPKPTYGVVPTFVSSGDLTARQGFGSLYAITEDSAAAIEAEGTTQGFKGCVWSERLWLDFDSYEAADRAERKLKELGYDYVGFDTGGRGAHFGILRDALPSHLLPQRDKQWVRSNFPEADLSIYTHLHPFRLTGTCHERTGERKRVVCEQRGSTLTLPPFERRDLEISTNTASEPGRGEGKSVFDCYRVMKEMVPADNGERHYSLVRLIYALRDDAKASGQLALTIALERNKLFLEPKDEAEVAQIVQSIYR